MLRNLFFLLLCVLWVAGCGNPDVVGSSGSFSATSNVQPGSVQFRELGSTVRQSLGAQGGTLEVVLSDGTRFALTVPAGALSQDTELSMTPVAVTGRLGLPVQMPLAVKISPSGTRFEGGAQLAISLPPSLDVRSFRPYVMEDSGAPMRLSPATVSGQTLTFTLFHLTVPGISPDPVPNPPFTSGVSSTEELSAQLAVNSENQAAKDELLRRFAPTLATRGAQVAGRSSQSDVRAWVEDFTAFRQMLQFTTPAVEQELRQLVDPVGVSVLLRGIELTELAAVANDDWQELKPINDFYQVHAQRTDLDTASNRLDGESIKRNIPIEFVVDQFVATPELLEEDQKGMAKFRVGYRLGANPVRYDRNRLAAQLDMVSGGELLDERVKAVLPNGEAIYNDVFLKPNARELEGKLSVIFLDLPLGTATLDSGSAAYSFKIRGKLKVSASTGAAQGSTRPVTATVREGRAPLPGASVSFQATGGGGTIPASANTNSNGEVTVNHSGGSGQQTVVISVNSGTQQASTTTTFTRGIETQLAFQGNWFHPRNAVFSGPWTESERQDWLNNQELFSLDARTRVNVVDHTPPLPWPAGPTPPEAYHPSLVVGSNNNDRWFIVIQPQTEYFPVGIPGTHSFTTGPVSRVGSRLRAEGTWFHDGLRRATLSVEFPEVQVPQVEGGDPNPALYAHGQAIYHLLENRTVDFDMEVNFVYLGRDVEP